MRGNITNTGYLDDSPDRFNDYNVIPSQHITMQGVSQPLMLFPIKNGKVANPVQAMPGQDYYFPESQGVLEMPLPQGSMQYERYRNGGPTDAQLRSLLSNVVMKKGGGTITPELAAKMLKNGMIYGKPITASQKDKLKSLAAQIGIDENGDPIEEKKDRSEDVEEYKRGGSPKAKKKHSRYTSKNIFTSINEIFARNTDLYGEGGKQFYKPELREGGWLDQYGGGGPKNPPPLYKPTYSDSAFIYNKAKALENYYDKIAHKYANVDLDKDKKRIKGLKETVFNPTFKEKVLANKQIKPEPRQTILENRDPNKVLLSDMITGAIDPEAPLAVWDSRIDPQGIKTYLTPDYGPMGAGIGNIRSKYNLKYPKRLSKEYKDAEMSHYKNKVRSNIADRSPEFTFLMENPKYLKEYANNIGLSSEKLLDIIKTEKKAVDDNYARVIKDFPGVNTQIPYYDPLAVKPWKDMTAEERKLRVDKYGTEGTPLPDKKSIIDYEKKLESNLSKTKKEKDVSDKDLTPTSTAANQEWITWPGYGYDEYSNRKGYSEKASDDKMSRQLYDDKGNLVGRRYYPAPGVGPYTEMLRTKKYGGWLDELPKAQSGLNNMLTMSQDLNRKKGGQSNWLEEYE
jgi:hypothetical protein